MTRPLLFLLIAFALLASAIEADRRAHPQILITASVTQAAAEIDIAPSYCNPPMSVEPPSPLTPEGWNPV